MKNEKTTYAGYAILGLVLLVGVSLIWDASLTIDTRVALAEEAAKPAEINLTLITPTNCPSCTDGTVLLTEIEKQNVRILNSQTVTADSEEGLAFIETFGISHVPAILINGEYDKENVQEAFASLAGTEQDGTLVIQPKQPVYVDVTTGSVIGLVHVTYLTDSSCTECYDPTIQRTILQNNFGVKIDSEKTIDTQSTEGRALLKQYAIKQTPTILLSSEGRSYGRLVQAWQQVGTIDEDGTLIFRQNAALGNVTYKDLATNTMIRPKPSSP